MGEQDILPAPMFVCVSLVTGNKLFLSPRSIRSLDILHQDSLYFFFPSKDFTLASNDLFQFYEKTEEILQKPLQLKPVKLIDK